MEDNKALEGAPEEQEEQEGKEESKKEGKKESREEGKKESKEEGKEESTEEKIPIAPPLKVLAYKTINKKFGWWSAVVLIDSWGRKQICFYLWQKKTEGGWRRKQKFAIHSQEHWALLSEATQKLVTQLN